MKKTRSIFSFVLAGLLLAGAVPGENTLSAQVDETDPRVIFYEDFEDCTNAADQALPEGWTGVATPADSEDRWRGGQIRSGDMVFPGASGEYYMYNMMSKVDHDAWAFSPGIELEAGKEYHIHLDQIMLGRTDGYAVYDYELLEVCFGSTPSVEGMDYQMATIQGAGESAWSGFSVEGAFTPEESGTYYLGFHSKSLAYNEGILIDNVCVHEASPSVYVGLGSLDFGTLYTKGPAVETQLTIGNMGTASLAVDLLECSPEITVEGFPLNDMASWSTGDVTVRLDVDEAGFYQGYITLATNDLFQPEVTVEVTAEVEEPRITNFYFEDFESGMPEGWEFVGNAANTSGGGIDGSRSFYGNYGPVMTTHCVVMGNSPQLGFWYRLSFPYGGGLVPSDIPIITVEASADYGSTWEQAWIMEPGGEHEHVKSEDFQQIIIDLPQYAGDTVMFRVTATAEDLWNDNYNIFIDNVSIGTQYEKDLVGDMLVGPSLLVSGTDTAFRLTVVNRGKETASGWTANLYDASTGEVLASVDGTELASNEEAELRIPYTAGESGTYGLYAAPVLTGDEEEGNNRSNTIYGAVPFEEELRVSIGDTSLWTQNWPICFYNINNAVQTIYYANEIATTAGTIYSLVYNYNFNAKHLSEDILVYVGETMKEDFSDNKFIDTASLTKVFEGQVYFPGGKGEFVVPFQYPYKYRGGNLVVFMYKMGNSFVEGKNFEISLGDGRLRTLDWSSDREKFDPGNLPAGTSFPAYPNIRINMVKNPYGLVSGTVTDKAGTPISGARVSVSGTAMYTLTDTEGKYLLDNVAVGTYALEVSKHGYATTTVEDVSILSGETTEKDIVMEELPSVLLGGKVEMDGEGIEGVYVRLEGFHDYGTYTDAEGNYEIEGVYAGMEYELFVSHLLYEPVREQIEVGDEDQTKDVNLTNKVLPVSDVFALQSEDKRVYINWSEPLPEFRHDNGTVDAELGFEGGFVPNYLFANVFPHKAVLRELSWFITSGGNDLETANLRVYGLDRNGYPDPENVLYEANVGIILDAWTVYSLPEPLEVEGFCIALSCNGFMSIGCSRPSGQYPLERGMSYYGGNVFYVVFEDMLEYDSLVPMIRAAGEDLGVIEYPATAGKRLSASASGIRPVKGEVSTPGRMVPSPVYKSLMAKESLVESYSVYRLPEGSAQEEWTLLGTTSQTGLSDAEVFSAESGMYQWAVVAVYGNGESDARLSNALRIQHVGNEDSLSGTGVVLYPNPFEESVHVSGAADVRSIRVVDLTGKTAKVVCPVPGRIDTDDLTPGVYLWIIENVDGRQTVCKMVKR